MASVLVHVVLTAWSPPPVRDRSARPDATGLHRRAFIGSALAAGLSTAPPAAATAAERPLPPAAVLLRVADVTDVMERQMLAAAALDDESRSAAGMAFGRSDMVLSVQILLSNTNLERIENAAESASVLRGISMIAQGGSGPMRGDEYRAMARQYAEARDELKRAFLMFPPAQRESALALVRRMRAEDEERLRTAYEEEAGDDTLIGR